jgi:hypothetical protein
MLNDLEKEGKLPEGTTGKISFSLNCSLAPSELRSLEFTLILIPEVCD